MSTIKMASLPDFRE
jgi:(S)-2-hydroxy-acid oxidase